MLPAIVNDGLGPAAPVPQELTVSPTDLYPAPCCTTAATVTATVTVSFYSIDVIAALLLNTRGR